MQCAFHDLIGQSVYKNIYSDWLIGSPASLMNFLPSLAPRSRKKCIRNHRDAEINNNSKHILNAAVDLEFLSLKYTNLYNQVCRLVVEIRDGKVPSPQNSFHFHGIFFQRLMAVFSLVSY